MTDENVSVDSLKVSIDEYINRISEGHRMHRKIQFLLDIRGLLIINKLKGDYVEFGVYRGEMMYAASKILSPHIGKYIGLDTFEGLPQPKNQDSELFVFESPGFMAGDKSQVAALLSDCNNTLIQGDFRDSDIENSLRSSLGREGGKISLLSVDCNWPSSVDAALKMSASYLQCGSIVFLDDYFVATRTKNFNDSILEKHIYSKGLRLVEFQTYPPCARAFIVED